MKPRGKARDGSWLYPTTRWAIYLRDDLACVYCGVTLDELIAERENNFLSVDHVRAKSLGGKRNAQNLITCCYSCNSTKSRLTLKAFCAKVGRNYEATRSRIRARRKRDLERYREAAKILLGLTPWAPINKKVEDHDFLVKGQWLNEGNLDLKDWAHLKDQEALFCVTCGHPHKPGLYYGPALEETSADLGLTTADIPF